MVDSIFGNEWWAYCLTAGGLRNTIRPFVRSKGDISTVTESPSMTWSRRKFVSWFPWEQHGIASHGTLILFIRSLPARVHCTWHSNLQITDSDYSLDEQASAPLLSSTLEKSKRRTNAHALCRNEHFPGALKMFRECTTTVPSSSITSSCGTEAKISPSDPKCFSTAQLEQSNSEQTRSLFLRSLAALGHWAGRGPSLYVTISNKSNRKQALRCLIVSHAAFWTATCFFVSFLFGPFENSGLDKKSNHKALTYHKHDHASHCFCPHSQLRTVWILLCRPAKLLKSSNNLPKQVLDTSHLQSNKETETLARKGAKA